MKTYCLPIVLLISVGLAACGGSESEPQAISAIPANKADIDPSGIPPVRITDGLTSRTLLQGEGAVVEPGHTAVVHYTGWLYDENAVL